jgi:hypothetical protein
VAGWLHKSKALEDLKKWPYMSDADTENAKVAIAMFLPQVEEGGSW